MAVYVKGSATRIIGVLETVCGVTPIRGFDPSGHIEYDGDTEVNWDSVATREHSDGTPVFVDRVGNEYHRDQIEERPD